MIAYKIGSMVWARNAVTRKWEQYTVTCHVPYTDRGGFRDEFRKDTEVALKNFPEEYSSGYYVMFLPDQRFDYIAGKEISFC